MYKLKKFFSFCLLICFLFSNYISVQALNRINYDNTIKEVGNLYEETYVDAEGNIIKIEMQNTVDKVIANTYVNQNLISSSSREKLTNGKLSEKIINTRYSEGLNGDAIYIYSTNDLIDKNAKDSINTSESFSATSLPSYNYLEKQYIPAYLSYAVLYGDQTKYQREKSVYFQAWTPLDVVASTFAGWLIGSGWGTISIITAFGATILGGFIIDVLDGTLTQDIDRWDYELFIRDADPHIPQMLAAKGYISDITTKVWAKNGDITTYYDIEKSGPYNNRQDFIGYGIYIYFL